MNKFLSTLLLVCLSIATFAQSNDVEMADVMRSNGKIYVVLTVVIIIFAGLLTYLILVDRKLRKLEKELNQ